MDLLFSFCLAFCYAFVCVCLYVPCNDRNAFFTSENPKKYHSWSCQNVCDALTFLLDNIFIGFGTKLYRQVVGNPMGSNSAPLVADLFLFCYERDFMMSLSDDTQADVIDAFNISSRYLDIFKILIMFILTIWLVKYTLQSSN